MKIQLKKITKQQTKNETLVLGLFEKQSELPKEAELLNTLLQKKISALIKEKIIQGKKNSLTVLHEIDSHFQKIIILGLGDKKNFSYNHLRQSSGTLGRTLQKIKAKKVVIAMDSILKNSKLNTSLLIQTLVEGIMLGTYTFTEFKKQKKEDQTSLPQQIIISIKKDKKYQKAIEKGTILANAVNIARDLSNRPSNMLYPKTFVETAQKLFSDKSLKITILNQKEMTKLGMNALLGVAQGSDHKPYLLVLEYQGKKDKTPPIALVGKGITFDSGGLSIKPSEKMDEMKGDMSGAATVLASLKAITELSLPVNVLGLIPLAENMPSGHAQRPGDIVMAMNGKTIEIINTDAEGRLILADAICYAVQKKAKKIIDFATLTGACVVALGDAASAILGNQQKMIDQFIKLGEITGEKLWQLPLYEEYLEYLKSDHADIMNCTTNRMAGTSCAAKFLEQFIEKTPWVHLDIASTNQDNKTQGYAVKGMSGVGVRTCVEYLAAYEI